MLHRLAAFALLLALPACGEPRTAADEPPCTTEAECGRLYRDALSRLQSCLAERKSAGYVGPGGPSPRTCDTLQAEIALRASALSRLHGRKSQDSNRQIHVKHPAPR